MCGEARPAPESVSILSRTRMHARSHARARSSNGLQGVAREHTHGHTHSTNTKPGGKSGSPQLIFRTQPHRCFSGSSGADARSVDSDLISHVDPRPRGGRPGDKISRSQTRKIPFLVRWTFQPFSNSVSDAFRALSLSFSACENMKPS